MRRNEVSPAIPVILLALLLGGSITPAAEDDLDKRITLDLKEAELQKVFALYGDILGMEVEFDPALDRTISITFDQPGTFPYICEPHWESHGMKGVVIVE